MHQERALISEGGRTATVVTREPVELLSVDKRSFKRRPTGFESEIMLKYQFARYRSTSMCSVNCASFITRICT